MRQAGEEEARKAGDNAKGKTARRSIEFAGDTKAAPKPELREEVEKLDNSAAIQPPSGTTDAATAAAPMSAATDTIPKAEPDPVLEDPPKATEGLAVTSEDRRESQPESSPLKNEEVAE